jgi:hypothetical protein
VGRNEARKLADALYEERDWNAAQEKDTVGAYKAYLSAHPGAGHAAAAQKALAKRGAAEQSDWAEANSANTTEAYQDFLRKHPDGEHSEAAKARGAVLTDVQEWSAATSANSAAAYAEYLRKHPEGLHSQEAGFSMKVATKAQGWTKLKWYKAGFVGIDEPSDTLRYKPLESIRMGSIVPWVGSLMGYGPFSEIVSDPEEVEAALQTLKGSEQEALPMALYAGYSPDGEWGIVAVRFEWRG